MRSTRGRSTLDHLLLGCGDLERGIAFVEERTGVRPAYGGVHPGRGTRNAVLSLGERCYLEVIAPDPEQLAVLPWLTSTLPSIVNIDAPRLIGWAIYTPDVDALAERLRRAGIAVNGPQAGSRARTDGRVLRWKMAALENDCSGMLPFFMQWDEGSPHPATDAPAGCRLEHFTIASPNVAELTKLMELLEIDLAVRASQVSALDARIAGPHSTLDLRS